MFSDMPIMITILAIILKNVYNMGAVSVGGQLLRQKEWAIRKHKKAVMGRRMPIEMRGFAYHRARLIGMR